MSFMLFRPTCLQHSISKQRLLLYTLLCVGTTQKSSLVAYNDSSHHAAYLTQRGEVAGNANVLIGALAILSDSNNSRSLFFPCIGTVISRSHHLKSSNGILAHDLISTRITQAMASFTTYREEVMRRSDDTDNCRFRYIEHHQSSQECVHSHQHSTFVRLRRPFLTA